MEGASESRGMHLVLRFSVGAVVAFLLAGLGVGAFMVRSVTDRAVRVATFHAEFVTNAVLAPSIGEDLDRPLSGPALEEMDAIVRGRILNDGRDVRVKIWSAEGTVLYSDFRPLVGATFPEERSELEEVFAGEVSSGVSALSADENVGERGIAGELFQTYVPLRLEPDGPIVAVAELYQDYSAIQGDIDTLVRTLSAILAIGLLILFAALLPIALRASRALRAQNRRLREQADQLSVLLAREQETVAELRDLNQRKSDFISAASHELRTPLTTIIGYVRALRRPELPQDPRALHEFLDAMDKQTTRLFRLIRGLLTSARLEERGEAALDLAPVELGDLVAGVAEQLHLNGRCRIDVATELSTVMTDRERVREILVELVDNGSKYSPDGGPVEVTARTDGDRFALSVHDHGVGIDPATSDRIFERFFQADQSSTRRFGGLGLGLYIVNGLVQELEGEISVASEVGTGTTFTVVLPNPASVEPAPD
jgi:signal transduction histidine kinase